MRFFNVNIIARDWRKLAQFYIDVFKCRPRFPESVCCVKDQGAAPYDEDTDVEGIYLYLPGKYNDPPTLEIFQYMEFQENERRLHKNGFGHIAFFVEDVEKTLNRVKEKGGTPLGEIVEKDIPNAGKLTFAYAKDPENNIIELQKWQ